MSLGFIVGAGVLGSVGLVRIGASTALDGTITFDIPPEPYEFPSQSSSLDNDRIFIPSDTLFGFNEWKIGFNKGKIDPIRYEKAISNLQAVGRRIQGLPKHRIQITGHTDSIGPRGYNKNLSLNRANAVRDFLILGKFSRVSQITTTGEGMDSPVASNATAVGRRQNRRVQITLLKT